MNKTITAVASAVSQGIQAEIEGCLEMAKLRIGSREVAREYVNTHIRSMPVLIQGEHTFRFKDSRGQVKFKTQAKNDTVWCVVLQLVIESQYTIGSNLAAGLREWATESQILSKPWDEKASERVANGFIRAMQSVGILDEAKTEVEYFGEGVTPMLAMAYKVSGDFLQNVYAPIERALMDKARMQCKPLFHQPEDWTGLKDGIGKVANMRLVNSMYAKTPPKPVLNAVNKLQRVLFVVTDCIADAAQDLFDNGAFITEKEIGMKRVLSEIIQYRGQQVHFPITLDWRGRMYYRGGELSPQGSDICKAAFQFATPELLGERGLDAICIHLANCLGYDKLSMNDRLAAVRSHLDAGDFDSIECYYDVEELFPKSDTAQALVAILDLKRILNDIESGVQPRDCWSALVCHQDGTCNGLQHMAAITSNRQTAEAVNCVHSTEDDAPLDIYGMVAEFAASSVIGDAADLMLKYGRSMAKNPVMVTGYGAGEQTVIRGVREFLLENHEDTSCAKEIGKAYMAAINTHANAVSSLTNAIKSRMEFALDHGGQSRFKWTTADGFVCDMEYHDDEHKHVRAGNFQAIDKTDETTVVDEIKTVGAMAPNFIHSIDATHLRMVVNACDWDLVTVHDSIGSRPCNFFDTNVIIRQQFVEVHQYDAMDNLCKNITGARAPRFRGDYNVTEALCATYIFS